MLDATDLVTLTMLDECDCDAGTSSPTSTTDTVNVVLGLHGQIEVDGMANRLHVNAPGGHVGGDQHANATALHGGQCTSALTLIHVAVQCHGLESLVIECLGKVIGTAFGRRENDCLIKLGIAQNVVKQAALVGTIICVENTL